MSKRGSASRSSLRRRRVGEAIEVLESLRFGPKQCNETAAHVLLALIQLSPDQPWSSAQAPLLGITPIMGCIASAYGVRYAPNTRETVRDDAVKYFVEAGLLLRNPDDPTRPTNSGKTVYQVEPTALGLLRRFGTSQWSTSLAEYLANRESIRRELVRFRELNRVAVTLPDGDLVALSPGGQNPLVKAIIEEFAPRGGAVLYIGDTESSLT